MELLDLFGAVFGYELLIVIVILTFAPILFWIFILCIAYRRIRAFRHMDLDQQVQILTTLYNQGNQRQLSQYVHNMPTPDRDECAHIAASHGIDPGFLYRM